MEENLLKFYKMGQLVNDICYIKVTGVMIVILTQEYMLIVLKGGIISRGHQISLLKDQIVDVVLLPTWSKEKRDYQES